MHQQQLVPYNLGYTDLDANGNYIYPLESQGVYEIIGTDVINYQASANYGESPLFIILGSQVNFPLSGSSGLTYSQINIGCSVSTYKKYSASNPQTPITFIPPYGNADASNDEGYYAHPWNTGSAVTPPPSNALGALIWEAEGKQPIAGEEYVIFDKKIDNIGKGYFVDENTPEYITDNIEEITKKFGTNKT